MIQNLINKKSSIAVIGLGYVGLPLAVAFAKKINVIGFDISNERIALYKQGKDITNEVGNDELSRSSIHFTSSPEDLRNADFLIIAVPTPVGKNKIPDLYPVESASGIVGKNLKKGAVVVYESTVYPGVTEDICVPILERESGLKCGKDFKVGYSPERINPGDKVHTVENIVKVVSGMDAQTLDLVADVYGMIIKAGIHKAPSIKVAEAAKVIENTQRDINIAFMNELSIIFNKMNIPTKDVLTAAGTKWNFLNFSPGLVGGHCIGVDPYYLTYKAEEIGYHPHVILSGRRINDGMGKYIAENIVKQLIQLGCPIKNSSVLIMGITFKENVPDIRNSKVVDIVQELREFGINVFIVDPLADRKEVSHEYGLALSDLSDIREVNAVVVSVAHKEYADLDLADLKKYFQNTTPLLIDVKNLYDRNTVESSGYRYWAL